MPEEIRDLIERINQDGIKAAEEKAQKIESAARQKADDILAQARLEAGEMIAAAKERIRKEDEIAKNLHVQAARDLLLSLRKEINAMLSRIVVSDVRQALTSETLATLLSEVIRNHSAGENNDITVFLNQEDLKILNKNFLFKLGEETKKKVILKPAEEISGGFMISFDKGKSCYDFTDTALAEYIGNYLKPKLKEILLDAVKE